MVDFKSLLRDVRLNFTALVPSPSEKPSILEDPTTSSEIGVLEIGILTSSAHTDVGRRDRIIQSISKMEIFFL